MLKQVKYIIINNGRKIYETAEKQTTSLNKLIIKVKEGERIQKNIGRIFRKYNIIEYKEPGETLTINDFYKGYGDGCFIYPI